MTTSWENMTSYPNERWNQGTLDCDEKVRASKERMLTAAKNDTSEIPRTFRMTP